MTRYLFILGIFLVSCSSNKTEPLVTEAPSDLCADFDAESWSVTLYNKGDTRILTGVKFFSIVITSESNATQVGQSVRGVLGDNEIYVIIPPKGKRVLTIADHLKFSSSKYLCELYYVNDLSELPRTFEFSFKSL